MATGALLPAWAATSSPYCFRCLPSLGPPKLLRLNWWNAFSDPLKVGDYDLLAGVSAGVSFSLDDSVDSSTLLRNADLALYKAKTDGRGVWQGL